MGRYSLPVGLLAGTALLLFVCDAAHNSGPGNEGAGIFPLTLHMPSVTLHKLTDGKEESDNILRDQISKLIAEWLRKQNDSMISVEQGDIVLSKRLPDQDFSPSGSRRLQVTDIDAQGTLLRSTLLGANVEVSGESASAHIEANGDAKVDLTFRLRAEYRKKIFGKWRRIARDTIDVSMRAAGKVKIRVTLVAKDPRVVTEGGKVLIKLRLGTDLSGYAHGWKIDHLDAGGCEIRVAGFKILSYCSLAEKHLRAGLERYLNKWTAVQAPELIKRLESRMRQKVGEEATIEVIDLNEWPTTKELFVTLALCIFMCTCCRCLQQHERING